ncbi:MAG: phage holin family protein [Actinomycetales bacterium]
MSDPRRASQPNSASLAALFNQTILDAKRLLEANLNLAKAEIGARAARIQGFTLFGLIAIGLVAQAGVFLLVTSALVLVALGLPMWAGFLIISVVLLLAGAGCGFAAWRQFEQIRAPLQSVQQLQATAAALIPQPHVTSGDSSAPGVPSI